jgi:cytidylate kinase
MYRAVTLAALRARTDLDDRDAVERLACEVSVHLERDPNGSLCVILDGEDVSRLIRTPEVTAKVSQIAAYQGVRRRMVELQRAIGAKGGIVMDGRDIGTVVFPNADVKIFMVADINARAERRQAELHTLGTDVTVDGLASELAERDRRDSTREASPLTKASDAIEIDTSALTIDQQVERVIELAREKLSPHPQG